MTEVKSAGTEVKICGVTTVADALHAVRAGADAIGVNLWSGSPRCVDRARARLIAEAIEGLAVGVAVFVDASLSEMRRALAVSGLSWAQLHGSESPDVVAALLPHAYKAIAVADDTAIETARGYPGEHLLLDASVPGVPGGTGRTFDWRVAEVVARERKVTLAGGLTPDNVASAIRAVRPFRVDVASGVEGAPGRKDPARVRDFIAAAKSV